MAKKTLKNHPPSFDPFYKQELKKYANPVPSREFILMTIREHQRPMTKEELFVQLNISDQEQQYGMHRRLRAMETSGQLVFTKGRRYALAEKLDLLKGTVIGHRDGYGFLQVAGQKQDLFIPAAQMRSVMHGDYVLAQPQKLDRKGRLEVRIVRVLEQEKKQIVGRFFLENNMGYVVADDSRIAQDILIPEQYRHGARMGQIVMVELQPRNAPFHQPLGKIVEVLGENMAKGMETDIAIRRYDIPYIFNESIKKSLKKLSEEVPEKAKQQRVDLRHLPLITIDGEDARDFDDAVYCQLQPQGGWKLWVAIADVSYYVRPNSALDKEARLRGNSVYFPNRVVPMLPEILSNGLCSLNPQVDRLCMVCEITVSASGLMHDYRFYEGVMHSHGRLTYSKVAKILEGDELLRQRYHNLVQPLEALHQLYQALYSARKQRGAIDFETIESKFIFNAMGRIERIEAQVRNDAHKIIEECMILANIAAAKFVEQQHEPALFRIHDAPSEEKLTAFRQFLAEFNLSLKGGTKPKVQDYANVLIQAQDRPYQELVQTMLLRSLSQAVYSADNIGHFGLGLENYAHFTSPIRRYSDLTLHRSIKYLLAKQQGSKRKTTDSGGYHYALAQIDEFAEQCSMTERRADEATRDVESWLKCEYMQDRVGEIFNGTISAVTGFGLFVRLDDLFIDGLVHISTLANEYYRFDLEKQRLVGEQSGTIYRLGDKVQIQVMASNLEQRQIDLEIVASKRAKRGEGKTAKKKAKNKGKSTSITAKKRSKKAKL